MKDIKDNMLNMILLSIIVPVMAIFIVYFTASIVELIITSISFWLVALILVTIFSAYIIFISRRDYKFKAILLMYFFLVMAVSGLTFAI